jgi:hypothetical protein
MPRASICGSFMIALTIVEGRFENISVGVLGGGVVLVHFLVVCGRECIFSGSISVLLCDLYPRKAIEWTESCDE